MRRLWAWRLKRLYLSSLATALQWRSTRDARGLLRMLLLPSSWYFAMRAPHRNISHAGCNYASISGSFWGHPNIYSLQNFSDSIVTLRKHWPHKCKQLDVRAISWPESQRLRKARVVAKILQSWPGAIAVQKTAKCKGDVDMQRGFYYYWKEWVHGE